MCYRHFIYNASSTPLLELMRFQIIQIEQHLNCYLDWKWVLLDLEIQEGDRYLLCSGSQEFWWSNQEKCCGEECIRHLVARRRGLHQSEALWLLVGSVASVVFALWASDLCHTAKPGRLWKSRADITREHQEVQKAASCVW